MDPGDRFPDQAQPPSVTQTLRLTHDLRNVLTVLAGSVDDLRGAVPQNLVTERGFRAIARAIDRALFVSSQLLTVARPDTMDLPAIDLNAFLTQTQSMLEHSLGDDVHLTLRLNARVPLVRANIADLEWMVLNLLAHARERMPDGGLVTVQTDHVDGRFGGPPGSPVTQRHVRLTVSDTGPGMSPNLQRQIFESIFSSEGMGTGLGLPTVAMSAHHLRGWLSVQSHEGTGTNVHVHLPLSPGTV